MATQLQQRWFSLWDRLKQKFPNYTADPQALYRELEEHYSRVPRTYHTLAHIEQGLAEFDNVRHLAEWPEAVEFAFWYHDMLGTELLSAEKAHSVAMSASLGEWVFAAVVSMLIRATDHKTNFVIPDTKFIADIDLTIFGQNSERGTI